MIAEVVERPLGDEPPPPVNLSARIDGVTTLRRPEVTDLVEIGRGGFGVVYRARQEQFRRDVAVKVISATLDARARAPASPRSAGHWGNSAVIHTSSACTTGESTRTSTASWS